jgi:uncharacterized protein (TIGR00369 family)
MHIQEHVHMSQHGAWGYYRYPACTQAIRAVRACLFGTRSTAFLAWLTIFFTVMKHTEPPQLTDNTTDGPYFGLTVPFMQYIGLKAETLSEDFARTRLPVNPWLVNSRGDVHGGTLMSVLDFTLSAAARSHDPHNIGVATIEMSTHFLDSARGELVFEAKVLRSGRSTAFTEGAVINAEGKTVCVARATFRLIKLNKKQEPSE